CGERRDRGAELTADPIVDAYSVRAARANRSGFGVGVARRGRWRGSLRLVQCIDHRLGMRVRAIDSAAGGVHVELVVPAWRAARAKTIQLASRLDLERERRLPLRHREWQQRRRVEEPPRQWRRARGDTQRRIVALVTIANLIIDTAAGDVKIEPTLALIRVV